ncbi:hypothetical protein DPEC_G00320200 [Dallia pectoralis]|uniref:Uncharacterized protein n=1 Tax=Dallia pectoralis TaxID=75939 RepID=A0ACC2F9U0_DALPE|nr:hypothetical protein DPEC_G00320200 [Dallia pectoralis]
MPTQRRNRKYEPIVFVFPQGGPYQSGSGKWRESFGTPVCWRPQRLNPPREELGVPVTAPLWTLFSPDTPDPLFHISHIFQCTEIASRRPQDLTVNGDGESLLF